MRLAESEWVPTDSRVKSPTLPQNLSPVLKVWGFFLASIVTLQGFIFYTSPLDTRVLANDEPKVATTQHTFSLAPPLATQLSSDWLPLIKRRQRKIDPNFILWATQFLTLDVFTMFNMYRYSTYMYSVVTVNMWQKQGKANPSFIINLY